MVGKVRAEQAKLRAHYMELCSVLQAPPEEETLCWATQTVTSRAFAFHESQGQLSFTSVQDSNTACLLPLIDSANHDPGIETNVTFDAGEDAFLLSAAGSVAQGEEVLISYGGKNNDQLLLNYGFVEPDNPEDQFTVLDAHVILGPSAGGVEQECPPVFTRDLSHPQLLDFARALQQKGQQRSGHEAGTPPGFAADSVGMGALDAPGAQPDGQQSFPAQPLPVGDSDGEEWGAVSPLENAEILSTLVVVCDAARERMTTTIEEDERLLQCLPHGGRHRLAVEFRVQKKRLLEDVAEELRRRRACLQDRAALFSTLFPFS